jgi:hypothetical protein
MKIEEGKTYLTRNGRRATVDGNTHSCPRYWFGTIAGQAEAEPAGWLSDGRVMRDVEGPLDLVALADGGDSHEEATFHALTVVDTMTAPQPRPVKQMILTSDPAERKGIPICTGVLDYFPLALAEVARVSKKGNDQHNPGQPLHWDKTKSLDHADCIPRHLIDRGSRDTDGERHSAKLAWRALALLQTELENEQKAAA